MNWKFWQPRVPECNHKYTQWHQLELLGGNNSTLIVKQARTCDICNYTDIKITRVSA